MIILLGNIRKRDKTRPEVSLVDQKQQQVQRTISSKSSACMAEGWLLQTSLHNWTNVVKKNVSTSTVRRRLRNRYGARYFCQLQSRGFVSGEGQLNQTGSHRLLQHHAILSGTRLVCQGFVLMQDNDLKHSCKICQKYIKSKEEQHVLQLLSWLTQSAVLNPIEQVWDELDRKVRAKQATSAAHF